MDARSVSRALEAVPTVASFACRIAHSKTLKSFEVQAFWCDREVKIRARHPYGPWCLLTVFSCDGFTCVSESGAPMCVSDVAFRLRRMMMDKPRDKRTYR